MDVAWWIVCGRRFSMRTLHIPYVFPRIARDGHWFELPAFSIQLSRVIGSLLVFFDVESRHRFDD